MIIGYVKYHAVNDRINLSDHIYELMQLLAVTFTFSVRHYSDITNPSKGSLTELSIDPVHMTSQHGESITFSGQHFCFVFFFCEFKLFTGFFFILLV